MDCVRQTPQAGLFCRELNALFQAQSFECGHQCVVVTGIVHHDGEDLKYTSHNERKKCEGKHTRPLSP